METNLISKLQLNGYKITSKGLIQKHSKSKRRFETAGQINQAGVYFYAQNVYPFKQGQNTLKDIFGNTNAIAPIKYIAPIKAENEILPTFENYIEATKSKNQFEAYLKNFCKTELDKEGYTNLYDLRGVKSGYLEDASLFPYIDYNGEFQSAKIVKYNSVTGKRSKGDFSNNWFHSYKPIKKELGKDFTKGKSCFFGEHLLKYNNKNVVIVESEKTAVLLSNGYPDTIFIATGGLAYLEGLNYDFLLGRKVFVFPDNNAKEWFKIAEKRGWWCSDVLENFGNAGEDVADYFAPFTIFQADDERAEIFQKLHEQLWDIDTQEITPTVKSNELGLKQRKNLSFSYSLPIPKELDLAYYYDNAKGQYFKGKHFKFFEDSFNVLNANIDFNKVRKTKNGYRQVTEAEFIAKLEKCFRITKCLNPDTNILKAFTSILENIRDNSNHIFNIAYVERYLVPIWNADKNEIERYYKKRNWRFASKTTLNTKEFVECKNNDAKLFAINSQLKKLQPLLKRNEFITPEQIGMPKEKRGSEFVCDIIKRFNHKVLGCSTLANYKSKVKVAEYLDWCIKQYDFLSENEKLYTDYGKTYYNTNIRYHNPCTTFEIPSVLLISDNTGVHRKIINEYLNFEEDANELKELILTVNDYISNPLAFTFERIKGYVKAIPNDTTVKKEVRISCEDAFDYELDLENSVLNIDESEINWTDNDAFLTSWIYFNNQDLTEGERLKYKSNPMEYFTENHKIAC